MNSFVLCVALLVVAAAAQSCDTCGPFEVTADTLPGYSGPTPFPFESYTGYVVVNETESRQNFYWLTKAVENPDTAPLILWYNGGPGCSSMGGLFTENGPFRVSSDASSVTLDQTASWNQFANMLFVEQPTGVGFSVSPDGDADTVYTSSDQQAAKDTFNFLEGFLQAWPEYQGRDIWLTGESYAGVYIPTSWGEILAHPDSMTYNQLRGVMLGNPVIACESKQGAQWVMNNFYYHGLVSQSVFDDWNNRGCSTKGAGSHCTRIFFKAFRQIGGVTQQIGDFSFNGTLPALDSDDLYQDFITSNASLAYMLSLLTGDDNVVEGSLALYLNRADVQEAIHALPPAGGEWTQCQSFRTLRYTSSGASMIPLYEALITQRPDVSILVYSGDIDIATVPFVYTMPCLSELQGSPVKGREWSPWYVNAAAVGYVEYFKEYTFATVKGAGHTVPEYQPVSAFAMASRFVASQNLDGGEIYFDDDGSNNKKVFRRTRRQSDALFEHFPLVPPHLL